jgi:transcriptional regulator with XRE-family HTH domain
MSALADRLRMAREQAGLSQGQVSRLLNVHRPTISEMEAGRRKVSAEELIKLAKLYDVSLEWLTEDKKEDSDNDERVKLAARELAKLEKSDLDLVLKMLRTLKRSKKT